MTITKKFKNYTLITVEKKVRIKLGTRKQSIGRQVYGEFEVYH